MSTKPRLDLAPARDYITRADIIDAILRMDPDAEVCLSLNGCTVVSSRRLGSQLASWYYEATDGGVIVRRPHGYKD